MGTSADDDAMALAETADVEAFLDSIANGVPELLAGIEVGWTPMQTRRRLKDPEFRQLVDIYMDLSIDKIEQALHELAVSKHLGAIQMVLHNRRSDKWRDTRRIEVRTEHTVAPELAAAARDVILATLRQGGVQALQPGGVIDTEATE